MKIAIAGHNGFLGNLTKTYFKKFGHSIILISKNDFKKKNILDNKISNADVIINFCGARIDKRWSDRYKDELINSRVLTTKAILDSIKNSNETGKYLLNASAIGIYSEEGVHTESSNLFENNFLSKVVTKWESQIGNQIEFKNYCIIRLGIVIDNRCRFLKNITKFYKFKISVYLGNKKNRFCFIDSYDFLHALEFVIDKKLTGVCNFVSPMSCTNYEVALLLKKIFNAWVVIKIPNFILKILFGENYYVLTHTPAVVPEKLLNNGFVFKFSNIKDSLNSKFVKKL